MYSKGASRVSKRSLKGVSSQFQRHFKEVSSVFQECFNVVLLCNFVAWISSQLPEQKEGLLFLDRSREHPVTKNDTNLPNHLKNYL